MITLKKQIGENRLPLTWRPIMGPNGKIIPNIIDSSGDIFGIATHRIANDGTVIPSVVCPYGHGCTFHEFIKLEGWKNRNNQQ